MADVNQQDRLGRTAFHLAAMHDLSDLIPLLISEGADHSISDIDGNLPVQYAIDFK